MFSLIQRPKTIAAFAGEHKTYFFGKENLCLENIYCTKSLRSIHSTSHASVLHCLQINQHWHNPGKAIKIIAFQIDPHSIPGTERHKTSQPHCKVTLCPEKDSRYKRIWLQVLTFPVLGWFCGKKAFCPSECSDKLDLLPELDPGLSG